MALCVSRAFGVRICWGSGFGCRVWGLGYMVQGLGSGVWGLASGVWGLGFGVFVLDPRFTFQRAGLTV